MRFMYNYTYSYKIGKDSYKIDDSVYVVYCCLIGEIPCGCSEHTGRTILNDIYHGEVETVFQLLFTDSDFYRSFLKSRKTTS